MEELNAVWNPHYFFKDGYYYTNMDTAMKMPLCATHTDPTGFRQKCNDDKCIYYKKPKIKNIKDKKYVFITIQDFKRRLDDLDKIRQFIKNISYMYESGQWVIETGKNKKDTDFNIHIHLLVIIRNNVKNHKDVLNRKWMRFFDTNIYHKDYYLLKQHRESDKMVPYEEWLQEKKDYFINDLKGSHKNTIDLGLSGFFGPDPRV